MFINPLSNLSILFSLVIEKISNNYWLIDIYNSVRLLFVNSAKGTMVEISKDVKDAYDQLRLDQSEINWYVLLICQIIKFKGYFVVMIKKINPNQLWL